jgi:hypothetical protein
MRKLWTAMVGALVISVAVAGIAIAANIYDVPKELFGVSPNAKGSLKKPVPAQLKFGFRVSDTENLRPFVVRQYFIAAEGLQSFPEARPTCTYAQATDPLISDPKDLSKACRKAIVGSGTIHNEAGASNDRSQKLTCDVKITLINISTGDRDRNPKTDKQIKKRGGIAIRIDQYVNEQGADDPARCPPIDLHEAIAAPFYDVKIEGISTAELRFAVPDTLAFPSGLANSVREVASTIKKLKGKAKVKGKERTVGFYSAVGRKGRTRTIRVTFIDESGAKFTETQKE